MKLHGGVGIRYNQRHNGDYGFFYYWDPPGQFGQIRPTDEMMFKENDRQVLLCFPHEKRLVKPIDQVPPVPVKAFNDYIDLVWGAAKRFCSQAKEIWIVGYSLSSKDWPYVRDLLRAARNCKRIVVQNPKPYAREFLALSRSEFEFKGSIDFLDSEF